MRFYFYKMTGDGNSPEGVAEKRWIKGMSDPGNYLNSRGPSEYTLCVVLGDNIAAVYRKMNANSHWAHASDYKFELHTAPCYSCGAIIRTSIWPGEICNLSFILCDECREEEETTDPFLQRLRL